LSSTAPRASESSAAIIIRRLINDKQARFLRLGAMAGVGLLSACVPAVALLAILLIILAGTLGAWLAIQISAVRDPNEPKKVNHMKRKSKDSFTI
jgi:hypothetical protein